MAPRDPGSRNGLTAEEFTARFQSGSRVLWTLAAGLLGDPAEAEDVCQEAFLAAFAKRDRFDPHTRFLAWMGRFVRNVAANELRKRARRRTESTDPHVLEGVAPVRDPTPGGTERGDLLAAEGRFDQDELDAELAAGLQALGGVPRACLLLRTLSELGYAEIAALLGIPEGTAMSHVHRARSALRARLDPARDGVRP